MPSNFKVSSDIDTFLRKQTREEAADYLGLEIPPAVWGGITGTLSNQSDLQGALDANASGVATNSSNITTNATGIATNATGIATNATGIATNATGIATNATGIATNVTDIATNATDIATNATAITTERDRATAAEALLAPIDNAEFTGTTTIPSADITTANFNAGATGGELSWNGQEKTLNLVTGADTTIQVGQETVMYCRNKTGTDILNGQVVKIVGAQGDTPDIELAIASNTEEAHRTLGVATQTILANNGKGFITLVGKVRGLDLRLLNGFTEGGLVYLSDTTAGALTPIKPEIEVEIGHALRLGQNNGTLGVFINNEAAVHELEQTVPHNTDSVVICNNGDNIQDKYDEAAALTPNGNPLSATNLASLIVMSGTYGNIYTPSDLFVNIIGIGTVTVGSLSLNGASALNYATIDNLTLNQYEDAGNYGIIKNIICTSFSSFVENFGLIQNVKCSNDFYMETNSGIIDGCDGGTATKSFGGNLSSYNNGTIKNCTASGIDSFGQQDASGVTENCIGGNRSFAAASPHVSFIRGTYKNCKGGNNSFFGINTDTSGVRTIEATYIDCTAGDNSFGFVNFVGAETQFAGSALNCTSGDKGFAAAGTTGGTSKIIDGAIIENCVAGSASFGTFNGAFGSYNEGAVLRCRTTETGATPFSATGTGIVRLCLDGNFNEVNLG